MLIDRLPGDAEVLPDDVYDVEFFSRFVRMKPLISSPRALTSRRRAVPGTLGTSKARSSSDSIPYSKLKFYFFVNLKRPKVVNETLVVECRMRV